MELPWVVETRTPAGRRRSPVWGVLALVAAVVCGALFLLSFVIGYAGLAGLVVWVLPVWGVVTLLAVAFAITAAARRGAGNVTMAAIAGGLLVVSNPVLFLVIGFALGILR